MLVAYCGKNCDVCEHLLNRSCPGCSNGPGHMEKGSCDIPVCCRDHDIDSCVLCEENKKCILLAEATAAPERRQQTEDAVQKQAVEHAEWMMQNAPILGKWLWVQFWLIIPTLLVGWLLSDNVAHYLPALKYIRIGLTLVLTLISVVSLTKLGVVEKHYRTAAFVSIILYLASNIMRIIPDPKTEDIIALFVWGLLATVPIDIANALRTCQIYHAHEIVMEQAGNLKADKWRILRKCLIIDTIILASGVLLLAFTAVLVDKTGTPIVGAIGAIISSVCMLIALLGMGIIAIFDVIFLYRMAKYFREYSLKLY